MERTGTAARVPSRNEELMDGHGERKGANRQQKLERHHDSHFQCKQKSKEALAQELVGRPRQSGRLARQNSQNENVCGSQRDDSVMAQAMN